MFKVTYQLKTYLQMLQMGCEEWQECLRLAAPIVDELRRENKAFAETGDATHEDKAGELKRSLPGACFQAAAFAVSTGTKKYNKGRRGRWREMRYAYLNGLVVIDADHVGNPREQFERIRQEHDLKQEGILLVYVSARGEGLKIVFKAREGWGNLICQQYEMASLLGILDYVDDACKDSNRLSFLTGPDDVLYCDEEELFGEEDRSLEAGDGSQERTAYDLLFGERYRQAPKGDSTPTMPKWQEFERQRKAQRRKKNARRQTEVKGDTSNAAPQPPATETQLTQRQQAIVEALNQYHYPETLPEGQNHQTFIGETAPWLLFECDNNQQVALLMAQGLSYVKNWKKEPMELENVIQTVSQKPLLRRRPKALAAVLEKAGIKDEKQEATLIRGTDPMADLPFDKWCKEIEELFDVYPCLREVCEPHPRRLWPFLLFASAAMMGTCMTLTWYRFYADQSLKCRLNYIILGVGDPTSGKGTLSRLQEVLLAPIIDSDKLADEATNSWKEMKGNAAGNKDTRPRDKIYNRMFGPRASNTEFIRSIINCKTVVDGEEMNNHLITVDSEKDNSINMSKSGGWQNRDIMVLKSFHNEFDSQHYSNNQSVSGRFRVYWNQIETCTPPTLKRLVNERNFNSGLDTRMGTIPMGKPDFDMMPLVTKNDKLVEANETLRQWAYRLDQRYGELPLWPLVEHVHKWCDERRAIAKFNDEDQADWLLIKRVPYYGINISAPYIDMRHWDEREQTGTYTIDDTDLRLCNLVLDIQYRTQLHWFYDLHRLYYDNQLRDAAQQRRRTSKFVECFRQLPDEFSIEKVTQVFGYANNHAAQKTLERLVDDKVIKRTKRGFYKKLVSEL